MPQAKRRFFKKSKEKESKTTDDTVQKKAVVPSQKAKKPQPPQSVQAPQPQKQTHSVINREIFGKSKFFLEGLNLKWGIIAILIILGIVWNCVAISLFASSCTSWIHLMTQRQQLTSQMNLWESIARQYPNYRDAYVEGAVLAYRLGDRQKEQYFIAQLQLLDPNFPLTKTLEKLTNLQEAASN